MARFRNITISNLLGWLLGIYCVVNSQLRRRYRDYSSVPAGIAEHPWLAFFSTPYFEFWFGVLLIMLVSWARKTRDEASDEIDEMNGVAVENIIPKPEARHSLTLQEAKRLRQEATDSSTVRRTRSADAGNPSTAASNSYFGGRLLSLLICVCAILAYYITSSPSIPLPIVFLVSPGSVLGPQAIARYGDSVALPGASTLGINGLYYGAILWFLWFRRKV
jgi:hypothetical protein